MKKVVLILVAVLSLGLATTADALILSGTVTGGSAFSAGGTFTNLGAAFLGPVGADNFDTFNLYGFDERQDVTLGSALNANFGTSPLAAGTTVSSHYIFFDPANTDDIIGSVLFDAPILAVMTSTGNLAASDFLANPVTTYLGASFRGLEANDFITISGATLNVDWTASTPGDYVRVLTQGTAAIPEPMSMMLFGTGLAGAALRRKFSA